MSDFTLRRWLLAVLFLLMPWAADAAGLGRLAVLSSLGQPFQAEIDLVSVPKEELGSLSVRLASPEAYQRANLQFNATVAGLVFRIDKRPDGQPYVKITSERPVNEFVVDLLVELDWASGRLVREYRALIDPPGLAPAPAAVSEPAFVPLPQPSAAVSAPQRVSTTGGYGPIERGETLSKIARSLKPEGVSVEQMLLGLFRSNPEAFIRKNMNLVRTGKILRVPEKEELTAIPQQEAVKEYRAQVADWNAYRRTLAAAPGAAPEASAEAKGRITGRVEDKTTAEARDVVRLSKGEAPGGAGATPGGKPASAKEQIRNLQEEIVAREKALTEANERIAQLEKTIKDMQRLVEIKSAGMAAAQQQAGEKPAPKPAEKPPAQAKPEQPKPKPVQKAAPPPPPEPSLLDTLLDPFYLGVGGGVIVLAGLGYWLARRRRRAEEVVAPSKFAPTLAKPPLAEPAAARSATAAATPHAAAAVSAGAVAAAAPAEELDPLDEARVYIAHGRDGQAETILKEALVKDPNREAVHVKLLEIYAARKDKTAFGKYAGDFGKLTGSQGENWLKVVAMGFALDPANPLYAAGKDAAGTAPIAEAAPAADLDFDLDLSAPGPAAVDVEVGKAAGAAENAAEDRVKPVMPDFNLEVPADEPRAASAHNAPVSASPAESAGLDFNIELPKIEVPGVGKEPAPPPQEKPGAEPDFKLDLGEINLNFGEERQTADASGGVKDAHWYDVQTKFDLAKAYQEMGDKAGAKEILQEVLKEGDAEQQAQAKGLLASLD